MWSRPGLGRATLLFADGHFVVLSENGELRLIEATPDGYREMAYSDLSALSWPGADSPAKGSRPLVRSPAWNAPVLANGLLYVRSKDSLVALQLIPEPGSQ